VPELGAVHLVARFRATTPGGTFDQGHFVLNDVQFNVPAMLTGPAMVGSFAEVASQRIMEHRVVVN